ncbi:Uncharacterised protein [Fluoribacter dumoffii]|uniref:Uncharacterized protein n=1 Tax=Fluoribacter dumoffii TaxID=463 RepID=A0A377GCN3_9GAMM|nr:Uncharacterised protein [Fluoribacter dumoffii]
MHMLWSFFEKFLVLKFDLILQKLLSPILSFIENSGAINYD